MATTINADTVTGGAIVTGDASGVLALQAAGNTGLTLNSSRRVRQTNYKAMKDAEQAASVRTSRGDKLKDSDWTQVADAPVDKAAWATYRQALRDVTAQDGFPWTIEWPIAP